MQEDATWKPAVAVYRHAAAVLGVEPGPPALASAHAWDCHGASRARLTTAWVSRLEQQYSPPSPHPMSPVAASPRPRPAC